MEMLDFLHRLRTDRFWRAYIWFALVLVSSHFAAAVLAGAGFSDIANTRILKFGTFYQISMTPAPDMVHFDLLPIDGDRDHYLDVRTLTTAADYLVIDGCHLYDSSHCRFYVFDLKVGGPPVAEFFSESESEAYLSKQLGRPINLQMLTFRQAYEQREAEDTAQCVRLVLVTFLGPVVIVFVVRELLWTPAKRRPAEPIKRA